MIPKKPWIIIPFGLIFVAQTSCFHLDADPSPGDRLKQDAHIPHMSHVQRPGQPEKGCKIDKNEMLLFSSMGQTISLNT